ncbi:MAG TPA: biotin/lipoyl-containing protein, partial [Verrucomicrobiae bacterium]|nr:biotin/lipoyl-containing protein [Verrucomicrobiae bacterium]
MATEVKLPRLGQGMESGTIVKWLKSEGEQVQKGDALYELDTDKVTQEVEAEASGVLLKIAVPEGEVEVGKTIAVIGEEGEEVAVSGNGAQPKEKQAAKEERRAEADTSVVQDSGPVQTRDGGRIKASPLARRIARERGIDLVQIRGTGPEGRVVAEDVERAATAPAAPSRVQDLGQVEVRQLSSVRKTIARRLTEAWQAPVFQLTVSADMTQTLALVDRLRELHP